MKVTDEMMEIAAQAWKKYRGGFHLVEAGAMKAALEAVFDSIERAQTLASKPSGFEEKDNPKKLTLLEYVNKKYKFAKDTSYDSVAHRTIEVISEYLEQRG